MNNSKSKTNNSKVLFVAAYLFLGAVHELAHVLVAWIIGTKNGVAVPGGYWEILVGSLTRASRINVLNGDHNSAHGIVRHAGWIVSLAMAVTLSLVNKRYVQVAPADKKRNNKPIIIPGPIRVAAWITCLEAITTDLLCLGVGTSRYFFCGNFGIIMVNAEKWISSENGPRTALDMLERMIYVTMMRGAQTGGVVAWTRKDNSCKSIRSRVVNGKRQDLSKGLRAKVERDAFSITGKMLPGIRGFFGHTRFATSSKATFKGTHPHRWTPPRKRRVYLGDKLGFQSILVENYITANGDFDFFKLNETHFDLTAIQRWLSKATGAPMPCKVDSAAIAGLIDLLRTARSFGLSLRYALLIASRNATMELKRRRIPSYEEFEKIGLVFEDIFDKFCKTLNTNYHEIQDTALLRRQFFDDVLGSDELRIDLLGSPLSKCIDFVDEEDAQGASLPGLIRDTIDAFFDNDLFYATRFFLEHSVGSFGIMVTSSLDAERQVCIAARGQPMSVAFYPKKGIVCFASELSAVKAPMSYTAPGGDDLGKLPTASSFFNKDNLLDEDSLRLDLDDLAGEVCLIDWGRGMGLPPLHTKKDQKVQISTLMSQTVEIALYQEGSSSESHLFSRLTLLEGNEFIKPLPNDSKDLVLNDIEDIPQVCYDIQSTWRNPGPNRFTAWNLIRSLRKRLKDRVDGKIHVHSGTVDILLTGCEVSLWMCEQFASDLQKAFPKLYIRAISSNKLLGVFGQNINIPSVGYPVSVGNPDLQDALVIIVSQSGGTFAPVACSNLLQSVTRNIFLITSEWDTQIGKQLRSMYKADGEDFLCSRIFSTDISLRPAEPCSVSVAATHQLLTNLFIHISASIISDHQFRHLSGAIITEEDLRILEKCNQNGIQSLVDIVGARSGDVSFEEMSDAQKHLLALGDLWSEHILENVKAYVMSFVYIMATVISGWPLFIAISSWAGLDSDWAIYLIRGLDALVYFFLPQINITVLRLIQGRNLRHRMVGRTVVIGDIPWVAQAAEAFLSKLFACSYSIAGVNVLSGNPADHLVHRHTHRIVRGTLLVCGRPDGRLEALTNSECTVCLTVNQASSIQSLGGTCESVTIGHNPSPLSLTKSDVYLPDYRSQFLCEKMVEESSESKTSDDADVTATKKKRPFLGKGSFYFKNEVDAITVSQRSLSGCSSSHALKGMYSSMQDTSFKKALQAEKDLSNRSTHTMGPTESCAYDSSEIPTFSPNREKQRPSMLEWFESHNNSTGSDRPSLALFRSGKRDESPRASRRKGSFHSSSGSLDLDNSKSKRFAIFGLDTSRSRRFNILEDNSTPVIADHQKATIFEAANVVDAMIKEKQARNLHRCIFNKVDSDGSGTINLEKFLRAYSEGVGSCVSEEQARALFSEADSDNKGELDFEKFSKILQMPHAQVLRTLQVHNRDHRGLLQIDASEEEYFGANIRRNSSNEVPAYAFCQSQHLAMELYESRIASLHRFVSLCVLFHRMSERVQGFFETWSFGIFGYRMDRTHSIVRIATTASPVSGADVRQRMKFLKERKIVMHAVQCISTNWSNLQKKRYQESKKELEASKQFNTSLRSLLRGGDSNGSDDASKTGSAVATSSSTTSEVSRVNNGSHAAKED